MGLTTGSIGAYTALTLKTQPNECGHPRCRKDVNPDLMVICHGGPIAEPEDAKYILQHTEGVVGFFGASSIERLATERAIEEQARKFKTIDF